MKKLFLFLSLLFFILTVQDADAQLKNLDKRIGDKLKRKIDQKADRTIDKTLNKGEKEIDEEVNEAVKGNKNKGNDEGEANDEDTKKNKAGEGKSGSSDNSFKAYSKFDFVPGENVVFYDDFSSDNPGDFPAKWNANGSGEVVTSEDNKFFELKGGAFYLPQLSKPLPENYTIEFDLNTSALDQKLSSTSFIHIILDDNNAFNMGKNFARVKLPFCQYNAGNIMVESRANGKEVINNNLIEDVRKKMREGTHVSIAVNKKRFRLWLDEQKVVDIPSLVPEGVKNLKFSMQGFNEDFKNYHFYISNVKIAEGSSDLRSKLIIEGKFVTNGILFDVNSDRIKPESYGVLKEIAQVLNDNEAVKVKILGHTDADGDEKSNLDLSKRRSASVKSALANDFGIAESRLQTDGKGETEPTDKNDTAEGKANNRRVEFVKL